MVQLYAFEIAVVTMWAVTRWCKNRKCVPRERRIIGNYRL